MAWPTFAASKIIIVPTARTIGPNTYEVELSRKAPLFDASSLDRSLGLKAGLGERAQLETKIPIGDPGRNVLWFGKYTFATMHGSMTEVAAGFENLGPGSRTVPYLAASRILSNIDVTLGIAGGRDDVTVYFVGIDYKTGERLHVLTDYNTGNANYASIGFKCSFSRHWSVKSGLQARHNAGSEVMVKITYAGSY